jgi:hypothetical protein
MAISSMPFPGRGPTARPASPCRRWPSWRSWQPWGPCRGAIWCATRVVSRRTASGVGRSSRRRARRVWLGAMPTPGRRAGAGRGCSSGGLIWLWRCVPWADTARAGSWPPSPTRRSARGSCGICSWRPSRLPWRLPVLAQPRAIGSPHAHDVARGLVGERARSGGGSHTSERVPSRLQSPPSAFPSRPSRGRPPRAPLRRDPPPS